MLAPINEDTTNSPYGSDPISRMVDITTIFNISMFTIKSNYSETAGARKLNLSMHVPTNAI